MPWSHAAVRCWHLLAQSTTGECDRLFSLWDLVFDGFGEEAPGLRRPVHWLLQVSTVAQPADCGGLGERPGDGVRTLWGRFGPVSIGGWSS